MHYLKPFQTLSNGMVHGYNIKFSPNDNMIAVAMSQNFGIQGQGLIKFFNIKQSSDHEEPFHEIVWKDAMSDIEWIPSGMIVGGSADGTIQLWRIDSPNPVHVLQAHNDFISSISTAPKPNDSLLCTCSWEDGLKFWNVATMQEIGHIKNDGFAYEAVWSSCGRFTAVCSGAGTVTINSVGDKKSLMKFTAHSAQTLCGDWLHGSDYFATGGSDSVVRIWDLRSVHYPMTVITSHELGVRRVKYCKMNPSYLASCSYDFTTRVHNLALPQVTEAVSNCHTEFAHGLDWSRHRMILADTSFGKYSMIYEVVAQS